MRKIYLVRAEVWADLVPARVEADINEYLCEG